MLDELHVRDLALIEEVWLEFGPGMTVLTGETGTGKTALLGALKLLLGDRADSGSVRSGAGEALVEGRFGSAGEEVVARRRVSADGRSRCTLDGEMATVGSLAETIGPLVDLHGQHEHQALLAVSSHVGYLDRWAGAAAADALAGYRAARTAHRDALAARDHLAEQVSEAARNSDYLRFVADEIAAVDPKPGEDADIEARLPALQHAERLAEAATEAVQLVRGDAGATDRLALAAAALAKVGGIDPALDALALRLDEAAAVAEDAGAELRSYRDAVEHDPSSLDALMARHAEINGLVRKYGPRLDDVLATRDDALTTLAAFDAGEEGMRAAEQAVAVAEAALREAAARLVSAREAAVASFIEALGSAVSDLAMQGARFDVAFAELPFEQWSAEGPHRVEFLYAPAPGQPPRPLAKIASGGEISRVMLALKGVLGEADTVETLVFDEIDAGIGGATAHAVGRRLAKLAERHQVIVVTHLAQVAAYADSQLVVKKSIEQTAAATSVERVDGESRVAEIARMLAGNDSETAIAHARELLGEARRPA
jgi:DNA repair protein RecN (Recombination protein N)